MSTSRRGFLAGMLALGAAPVIVKASSLMKISPPSEIWVPNGGFRKGEVAILGQGRDAHSVLCTIDEDSLQQRIYNVGRGQKYPTLDDVPMAQLKPGTIVNILGYATYFGTTILPGQITIY